MNKKRLLFVLVVVAVGVFYWYRSFDRHTPATSAKSTAENAPAIFQNGYIAITPAQVPGWFTYQDSADAFHFQFPNPLKHRDGDMGWELLNSSDGTRFSVRVVYALRDPKLYNDRGITPENLQKQSINGLKWVFWTFKDGAGYYTYRNNEAISLVIYAPDRRFTFSDADTQLLKQIVHTFAFDDISSRMDRRIARLKIGQEIGNLTINRILPAADSISSRFVNGILGEVDFRGNLTVAGGAVDDSILRDWDGLYGLDASSTALIPKIGSVVYKVPITGWEHLFQVVELAKRPKDFPGSRIIIGNLKEIFVPGGGAPHLKADFIGTAKARPN